MKIGKHFEKFRAVESVEKHCELTERNRAFIKMLRFFDYVVTFRVLDKHVYSVILVLARFEISLFIVSVNKRKAFSVRIAAAFYYLRSVKFGYEFYIIHKPFHVREKLGVDSLNDISYFFPVLFENGYVSSVDKSAAVRLAGNKFPVDFEMFKYLRKFHIKPLEKDFYIPIYTTIAK